MSGNIHYIIAEPHCTILRTIQCHAVPATAIQKLVLWLPQFIHCNIDYAIVLNVVHLMIYLNEPQVTHQNIPTGNKMSTGWWFIFRKENPVHKQWSIHQVSSQQRWLDIRAFILTQNIMLNVHNFMQMQLEDISIPTDGLAPFHVRPSADTVMITNMTF